MSKEGGNAVSFLYNRKTAVIALAVCVVFGLLFGTHRTLTGLRAQVETVFVAGEMGDGLSIDRDLTKRAQTASNLVTVAKRYLDGSDPLLNAVQTASQALSDARGPGAKFDANMALTDAFNSLYLALEGQSLSDEDAKFREKLNTEFLSLEKTIGHDGYNRMADEFNRTVLGAFPASMLGGLTGVRPLELFQ